jgi:hypothetical protein
VRAIEVDPQSGKLKITATEPGGEQATTDLDREPMTPGTPAARNPARGGSERLGEVV